jgi:hypothetical protein
VLHASVSPSGSRLISTGTSNSIKLMDQFRPTRVERGQDEVYLSAYPSLLFVLSCAVFSSSVPFSLRFG